MNFKNTFLLSFFHDRDIAAIAASSRFLIARVLHYVPPLIRLGVEYGAGSGVMTHRLLERLAPDGRLFVVEQNNDFADTIAALGDPRIVIIRGDAQSFDLARHLRPEERVDIIIASIPFSFLSASDRESFVLHAHRWLTEGGRCIIFHQYSRLMRGVLSVHFSAIKTFFVLLNMPPCFFFVTEKIKARHE